MTKRMLIDASHAEETRVVVLDGNRLEDFDVETATKKQLKGNIYLAKVVRVEPSLQAAFVEYGGGRHGFLAFSEIHPDYYQIPIADRQRLLEMQAAEEREDEDEEVRAEAERGEEAAGEPGVSASVPSVAQAAPAESAPPAAAPVAEDAAQPEVPAPEAPAAGGEDEPTPPRAQPMAIAEDVKYGEPVVAGENEAQAPAAVDTAPSEAEPAEMAPEPEAPETEAAEAESESDLEEPAPDQLPPETINGEPDTGEEVRTRRTPRFMRNYRIQEVIKRRQILLVQVVKEERGTKGAALTTYISLAGRFCVLMPNSPRGGGISRKITSAADRKRLREITSELEIPKGMGLIVRTAGANRPKAEIKRDCEYLMRLWDDIREHTMRSVAPALIYEEASLIKRAIRDVYSRDIDEICVDGDEGWKAAHEFMRMLMPSHARKVLMWRPQDFNGQSLFGRYQVEAQLDAMLSPTVQLKSGGYLVINQAEALVAIDVNSGRATRERGIEETALRTNMEASEEVARQLRLRDLAGLIVIDFIDMEVKKNNASVERRLKESLKGDRARIQVGHISHFGLLEMSRQRLRPSLTETSFVVCPHCAGLGLVRSIESSALHVLRAIEDEGAKGRASLIQLHAASSVIMYILNHKREQLALIELRSGMRVEFATDETLVPPEIRVERLRAQVEAERPAPVVPMAPELPEPVGLEDALEEALAEAGEAEAEASEVQDRVEAVEVHGEGGEAAETSEEAGRRRRRRRRRRGGRDGAAVAPGAGLAGGEAVAPPAGEHEQPAIPPGAFPVVPEPSPEAVAASLEAETAELPLAEVGAEPAALEGGAAEPAQLEMGTAEEGDSPRRRRGRRGGRRRRREDTPAETAAETAAEPAVETPVVAKVVEVPIWSGPTPADPFGQTFDIFDLMDQQEQEEARARAAAASKATTQRAPAAKPAVVVAPAAETPVSETAAPEAPVTETPVTKVPVTKVPVVKAPVVKAPVTEAPVTEAAPVEAEPAQVPAEAPVAAVPVAEPAVVAAPVSPAELPLPEPAAAEPAAEAPVSPEPAVGPAVKPVVVSSDTVPAAERKRGWWRR